MNAKVKIHIGPELGGNTACISAAQGPLRRLGAGLFPVQPGGTGGAGNLANRGYGDAQYRAPLNTLSHSFSFLSRVSALLP
jgi:hypothetical protein